MNNPEIRLELKIKLSPEQLEGGFTRYTTEELLGFRILCEPNENPIPLIERAVQVFMPAWIKAAMHGNASMKGVRIIPLSARTLMGVPAPLIWRRKSSKRRCEQ